MNAAVRGVLIGVAAPIVILWGPPLLLLMAAWGLTILERVVGAWYIAGEYLFRAWGPQ